jgi:hypothetical protein
MLKRILKLVVLATGIIVIPASSMAATGRTAKGVIVKALERSSKVMDKQGPFKTKLLTKSGNVREFRASNLRTITIPGNAPAGAQGGMRLTVGGMITGKINLKTERVTVKSVSMAKSMPRG